MDMRKSQKELNIFNRDVEDYNQELCRLIKKERGIMHWRHKRLFNTLPESCEDGTHMDTDEGKLRYKISIYGAIREAVRQIRRGCDCRRGRKTKKPWYNREEQEGCVPMWQQVARGRFTWGNN